jgi:broad specificity phosphatase PhoE
MTKILLIRHGHVDGIAPERFRGRADLPLTNVGLAQAHAVAARIAAAWRPSKVYTSPLARCVATGAAIASACRIPTEVCGDLIDIDYGAWQGRTCAEVEQSEPKLYAAWRTAPHLVRFPQGDSLQDLAARAADALRLALAQHRGETVVLVAHDSVNRALLLQLLEQPSSAYWRLAQAPCCINEIEVADCWATVLRANETAHLDGIAAP